MCVIVASKIKLKNTNKENWFLYKLRDRAYTPDYKIKYRTSDDGVQSGYLVDNITDWSEGVNESGIMIVNTTLQNHEDSQEGIRHKRKVSTGKVSRDGVIIREALRQKNIKSAVDVIINSRLSGCTFVSDGKRLFVIEIFLNQDNKAAILADLEIDPIENEEEVQKALTKYITPEDYDVASREILRDKLIVRTNHGIYLKNAGYVPEDGEGYDSSFNRRKVTMDTIKKLEPEHPFEILTSLKNLGDEKIHKVDMMRPIRTMPDSPYQTTTILGLTPTGIMFVVPVNCTFEDTSFNRINKERRVHVVVLPKKLPLFESKYDVFKSEELNPSLKKYLNIIEKGIKMATKITESDESQYYVEINIDNTEALYKLAKTAKSAEQLKLLMMQKKNTFPDKDEIDFSKVNWKKVFSLVNESKKEVKMSFRQMINEAITPNAVMLYLKKFSKYIGASDLSVSDVTMLKTWTATFTGSSLYKEPLILVFRNIEGKKIGEANLIGYGFPEDKFYVIPDGFTSMKDFKSKKVLIQNTKGIARTEKYLAVNDIQSKISIDSTLDIGAEFPEELGESESNYTDFFIKKLKKYKVESPAELSPEEKKKFFEEIDRDWQGDDELEENTSSKITFSGILKGK